MERESELGPRRLTAALATVWILTGLLGAQSAAPPGGDGSAAYGPMPMPRRQVFERVEAIIGDRVVLKSTIDRELEANLQGRDVPPVVVERMRRAILDRIVDDEVWVQQGKVLGQQSPEMFEEFVEHSVDERMDELVQDYGSVGRAITELEAIGQSWRDTREAYRNELLSQIAQRQALYERFGANWTLLVTPEELRDYYDSHPEEFAAQRATAVAWITFRLSGEDRDAVLARAREAAETWRREPLEAAAIAERFGGIALRRNEDVRPDDPTDSRAGFLKDFARDGAEGDVSDPVETRGNVFVMRIEQKVEREALAFTDQEVQDRIRDQISRARYAALREKIARQKRRSLFYQGPSDAR